MGVSIDDFTSAIEDAAAAIGDGNYALALRKARQAQMLLAALPDGARNNTQVRFGREQLPEIIKECKAAQIAENAEVGLQSSKIRYT